MFNYIPRAQNATFRRYRRTDHRPQYPAHHEKTRHDLGRSEKEREIRDDIRKEQKKKTFVITERSLDLDERKRAIW